MAKRRKDQATESARLLDLWSPPDGAGSAVGCITTTYTLDAAHFEEQCLARFVAMETSPEESAKAYLIEREEKFSQMFCCVLVDQRHARATRSLRWHLLPVRIPGAIQHAKLTLLLWEKHLRVLVGSANLTVPAYRTNYESVACLDFSAGAGAPLAIARECLQFLAWLAEWAPGATEGIGPRSQLIAFLGQVRQHVRGWPENESGRGQPRPALVPLLPRKSRRPEKVTDQLSHLWEGSLPDSVTVVSPFFDQTESALDLVYQHLASLITTRGDRSISFRCVGDQRPDKGIEAAMPRLLFEHPKKHQHTRHILEFVAPRTKGEEAAGRPLHSKAIVLKGGGSSVFLLGSSNFTVKGLGLDTRPNAELNLAYVIPATAGKFFDACLAALPPAEAVDNPQDVSFLEVSGDSSADDAANVLLPVGFYEALFEPRGGGGLLHLRLVADEVPQHFNIHAPSGQLVLGSASWDRLSSAVVLHEIDRPVSSLLVKWQLPDGAWVSAAWVVNVTKFGLLPPPSELAQLNLEDLIAILTSSRPIHWLVAERLAEREDSGNPTNIEAIDPHRKVDTSRFLMRRMRSLARALEGLRHRLESPVATTDGLRWRLQGPFGPMALAKAILFEGETGAPFFIAEIAGTLRQLHWQFGPGISPAESSQLVSETLRDLRNLALRDSHIMPGNLRAYVTTELADIPA
ncbi:MAG TPA: hypothetical protein VMI06_12285 [Terriglobia bacterium]|nr:hypothetical protein [Terriglobia bacterium]